MYVHTLMHVLPFVYAAMNAASTQIVLVLLAADFMCAVRTGCFVCANASTAFLPAMQSMHPRIQNIQCTQLSERPTEC